MSPRDIGDPTRLLGTWSFERVIEDLGAGESSHADGVCELSGEDEHLILWRERATLRHAEKELAASRDLRIENDGNNWHVKFDDGRYFHPWSPGETVIHHCGADLYEGYVELGDPAEVLTSWQVTWRIRGPRKDLRIRTRLSLATDCDDRR